MSSHNSGFLNLLSGRGPGKRQFKPSAFVEHIAQAIDDEDDDEEFRPDESDSSSGSGSDGSGSSSDSDCDEVNDDQLDNERNEQSSVESVASDFDLNNYKLLCSVCLKESEKSSDVVQCDRCGVCVHEGCYVTTLNEDDASVTSSASTEPWFCEPCLFGLEELPYCELCPNRFGAFKRTDIGGRWVHVVCALYTPGITFADADKLTGVSLMELDFSKKFGRKVCSACSSRLSAYTGIATQCDAALCNEYFHPTCAQKLGVLTNSEEMPHTSEDFSFFLHCLKHSNRDLVSAKKAAFARFLKYEEYRAANLRQKTLNAREARYVARNREIFEKVQRNLYEINITWPGEPFDNPQRKQRRIRPIQTSFRYIGAFAQKIYEQRGVSRDDFEREFFRVRGNMPPGSELSACSDHRRRHSKSHKKQRLKSLLTKMNALQEKITKMQSDANKNVEAGKKLKESLREFLEFRKILRKYGVTAPNPFTNIMQKYGLIKAAQSTSSVAKSPASSPSSRKSLNHCAICSQKKDQLLLVECDNCKNFYHIGCLNPPLERIPKKAYFKWFCSSCSQESDSEAESPSSSDAGGERPRKLRVRSDFAKAKKMQLEQEQSRAYRAIMQTARQTSPAKILNGHKNPAPIRKRKSVTPPVSSSTANKKAKLNNSPSSLNASVSSSEIRRGRGRPRKSVSSTGTDAETSFNSVGVRKRGRPKKSELAAKMAIGPTTSPQRGRSLRKLTNCSTSATTKYPKNTSSLFEISNSVESDASDEF